VSTLYYFNIIGRVKDQVTITDAIVEVNDKKSLERGNSGGIVHWNTTLHGAFLKVAERAQRKAYLGKGSFGCYCTRYCT
jgi:hypothetical protein